MDILVFAGIIILIFILAAASPVTIYLDSVRSDGEINGSFSISWLIFFTSFAIKDRIFEISILGRRIHRFKQKEKPETQKSEKPMKIMKQKKMPSAGLILDAARLVLGFIRDILSLFKVKYLDLHVTFGLDNPAYTGILSGYLYAIRGAIQSGSNIRWTSDFTRYVFDWNLKLEAAFMPIMLLFPLARLVTSRQFLRFMKGIL
jgi:hypothetical protein